MGEPTKTINVFGDIEYRLNGKRHRTEGPAVEYPNGDKYWYVNGKLHRINGPAVERINGDKWWCINGEEITIRNYRKFVNKYPGLVNQFLAHQVLNG